MPIGIIYYNYQLYKKLENLYQKTNNIEKKLNYYLSYHYIDPIQTSKSIENINANSNIIISSNSDNYNNSDKIYLVL